MVLILYTIFHNSTLFLKKLVFTAHIYITAQVASSVKHGGNAYTINFEFIEILEGKYFNLYPIFNYPLNIVFR